MDATLSLSTITAKAQQGLLAVKMANSQQKMIADVVDAASKAVQSAPAATAGGKGGVVDILA